ncbi:MAG: GWxTD domain-containing protein [Candidatus Eisenbacteria bacterium]
MRLRTHALVWAVLIPAIAWSVAAGATPAERDRRVDLLLREAHAQMALGTIEGRRAAKIRLEEAEHLAPERHDITLDLARLYQRMGFLGESRAKYESVAALRPNDREARIALADLWLRDWLKYFDSMSLLRATDYRRSAARLDPPDADAWLGLVPLEIENGNLVAALDAAERAQAADPRRVDALLAVAHAAWRLGDVARADTAFRDAIPRLAVSARRRYEDISPVSSERDTATLNRLTAPARAEFLRRFWVDTDPDPSTPENEAQLEYWSRVTQAYFLFYDTHARVWDQRGEVYVRYGPPSRVFYNPVGLRLSSTVSDVDVVRTNDLFPINILEWDYPELGMVVQMEDRVLTGRYTLPVTLDRDPDPRPDLGMIDAIGDKVASGDGRGVFPALPPRTRPLPVDGLVARMESATGAPRVIGLLATPLAPGDSAWATWVVLDSTRHEVARMTRALSPSACDPARLRVADFADSLPPGDYLVGLGVRDAHGARGSVRAGLTLEAPDSAMSLSDLVVSCGGAQVQPGTADTPPLVRLNPNPAAVVTGRDPLVLYFEAYRLTAAADGLAHLEIAYTVRGAERDPRPLIQRILSPRRPLPEVSTHRTEEQVGAIRRQFVDVPVQTLPSGHYRVEVVVKDLTADTESARSAFFDKR